VELYCLTIHELRDLIQKGEVSPVEVVQKFLTRIGEVEERIQAFNTLTAQPALATARRLEEMQIRGEKMPPLAGIPIAIKDVICTKGVATTCSSKILENYIPPYDATVMSRLNAAGCVMLGKTNMDEFAMGSSTENSGFFTTRNPWDLERAPGGSSGGSSAAVAAHMVPLSLGSDTGGSIRQPAALCNVDGLKPTYGRVSRYGLVAFASSLDQIGPFARDIRDIALLSEVIAGYDRRDSTCVNAPVPEYTREIEGGVSGLKIGMPREYFGEGIDPEVEAAVRAALKLYEKLGAKVAEISLPHTQYAVAVYYIVATAEASSNLARYDGVHYGHRTKKAEDIIELYSATRAEGFGPEVKRRIMLGTYALSSGYYDAYYLKASKVRALIRRDFEEAYKTVDVIVCPTSPTPAFKIGEKTADPLQMYLSDIYTISTNLAAIPGISIPCGFTQGNLPIGMQILGKHFDEATILRAARAFERETDYHTRKPPL
jgi:aspartyl-tRNA(Asn)/glutamyl-tRNA(Gln) amidotransferase subunit A